MLKQVEKGRISEEKGKTKCDEKKREEDIKRKKKKR